MGEVLETVKEEKLEIREFPVSSKNIGRLITLINKNTISNKIAKDIFPDMMKDDKDLEIIV